MSVAHEEMVVRLTGGIRVGGPLRGRRRLPYDVLSGNGTRLEVKHSNQQATNQWGWNVRKNRIAGLYDRMILVGTDLGSGMNFFDVPARFIVAWDREDIKISCSRFTLSANRYTDFGYALWNWFVCSAEQLAERYGPGRERLKEFYTAEQEEMLAKYEKSRAGTLSSPTQMVTDLR